MTSTLAGILVEEGLLTWETSIIDIFPELDDIILDRYKEIKIDQLLSHTGGIIDDEDNFEPFINDIRPLDEQRYDAVKLALSEDSGIYVGTHNYSNLGYTIAGAMLEKITNETYENLMIGYLFSPLDMNNSGFGASAPVNSLDQPWGHYIESGNWVSVDPADSPVSKIPFASPAGSNLYTTHDDLSKYIVEHLNGFNGISGILTSQTFEKLHTPFPNTTYSLGWNVDVENNILSHSGSDTNWFATLVLFQSKNTSVLSISNSDSEQSRESVSEILNVLIHRLAAIEE